MSQLKKILILGAGYGGIVTAINLQKQLGFNEAEVTLVNINDYHYITTHLHAPAAGTFPHDKTRVKIDDLLDGNKVNFIQDAVTKIRPDDQLVELKNREEPLAYDYLVVGLGSAPATFGIEGLLENSMVIRNINSVRMIRTHIEYMFSRYRNEPDRDDLVTIVVGGAGFTGIEFVGELAYRMPELCKEYDIPREKARIINIEAAPTALPGFDKELVEYAMETLERRGVEFMIGTPIKACQEDGVVVGDDEEKIKAATVVWTGGVTGNPLVADAGFEVNRGRVQVDEYLRAPNYDNVFIVGDSSLIFNEETGRPFPPTAQMATQQGINLAKNLVTLVRDGGALTTFKYEPKGTVASLGKGEGIGVVGKKKLFGWQAAQMKKIIDLRYLYMIGGISLAMKKGQF
ncbi:NAD(P)/FAD-dependent oxidoreductase [Numidum massiliense]|uniref:NAD(P)/FAD-dependent oxidoreductase n=1 Tax=Numidum massiliense TaxID=1522315 RepID=UPI0006D57E4F|nr:NAD(P)/FAD-dependent oxidoreductase [Numidum massiliense]